jgi:RNA polymerase sigma factor FliA
MKSMPLLTAQIREPAAWVTISHGWTEQDMGQPTTTSRRLSSDEALELWRDYKRTNDPRLRDRLILTFAPMVKYIVYRKAREIPARCEVDDFISCGLEALMRSIDRYDPEKGSTIEQFAWTRIHGAVLDEMRRNDWAPRSLRRWERDINRAQKSFVYLYRRLPTAAELSEALGISLPALHLHQDEIARSDVGSLNTLVLGDDDTAIERIDTLHSTDRDADPEFSAMRQVSKLHFRGAFERLPERDRKVAILLYVHNMTLREIGEILGVTESRVCQIHAQLKRNLREQLKADEQLFLEVA